MKIIGIDPGYGLTGWGIINIDNGTERLVAYGAIETRPDDPIPKRLDYIYGEIHYIVHLHQVAIAAVERLFWGRNVTTAINVAQARGVILTALQQQRIEIYEYWPKEIKAGLVDGRATKRQVQEIVKTILGLDEIPRPDDAADALAAALCLAREYRVKRLERE